MSTLALCGLLAVVGLGVRAQGQPMQALDENGAPLFRVDPFWPKPLPHRWSMQQVTGIHVDHLDHIWFLNRGAAAEGDEIGGGSPPRIDCCVRGPGAIELDQDGHVLNAWGGHGMPLGAITNERIPSYTWTGAPPPDEKINAVAQDSKLNIYTGEVEHAKRIQKFVPVPAGRP